MRGVLIVIAYFAIAAKGAATNADDKDTIPPADFQVPISNIMMTDQIVLCAH